MSCECPKCYCDITDAEGNCVLCKAEHRTAKLEKILKKLLDTPTWEEYQEVLVEAEKALNKEAEQGCRGTINCPNCENEEKGDCCYFCELTHANRRIAELERCMDTAMALIEDDKPHSAYDALDSAMSSIHLKKEGFRSKSAYEAKSKPTELELDGVV